MSRPAAAPVDGLLLLDKPSGMTSNQALQKVKRLMQARKAGHTGSLDPAATGMLPLCFGEATKICAFLLEADKTYRVTARLGETTDTGDADGQSTGTAEVPDMEPADWERVFEGFLGRTEQIPPMYSALKKDGKRLYELARKGQVVEREPRPIHIHELGLLEARGDRLVFRVRCSKGTYVRTLVEDLAKAAGTLAHTARLHRESVADFRAEDMLDMNTAVRLGNESAEALRERLLPVDLALAGWPARHLDAAAVVRFRGGQAVAVEAPAERDEFARVYGDDGQFVGVGWLARDGQLSPRRIFNLGG